MGKERPDLKTVAWDVNDRIDMFKDYFKHDPQKADEIIQLLKESLGICETFPDEVGLKLHATETQISSNRAFLKAKLGEEKYEVYADLFAKVLPFQLSKITPDLKTRKREADKAKQELLLSHAKFYKSLKLSTEALKGYEKDFAFLTRARNEKNQIFKKRRQPQMQLQSQPPKSS